MDYYGKKYTEVSKIKMSISSKLVKAVIITDIDSGSIIRFISNSEVAVYI